MIMEEKMHRIHIIEDFISKEDAETLIKEQNFPSSVNPYPDYYKERFGGTSLPYNPVVMNILKKYSDLSNKVHKDINGFVNPIYTFKSFGSHWVPGTKGGLHLDAQDPEPFIEFSTVIYLNDEFEGGHIFFPNQNFEYKPKKYSAVFFPSAGSEYIHGITTVTSGHRYTALYMHTSLPQHADPEFATNKELYPNDWKAVQHELTNI
jgi:hypothetical protein